MKRYLLTVVISLGVGHGAAPAMAQLTPTFSIDFQSAQRGTEDSFRGIPLNEGMILTTGHAQPNGPPFVQGSLLFDSAPPPGVLVDGVSGLGLRPPGTSLIEVDAISYGSDDGSDFYFSVDEFAVGNTVGFGLPNLHTEGAGNRKEASADVFAAMRSSQLTYNGNIAIADGNGDSRPGLGLIDFNEPNPGLPDTGDNLDALDMNTSPEDLAGPIFFSLNSGFSDPLEDIQNRGTAQFNGYVGGDVLMVSSPGESPLLYAPASMLGLDQFGEDTDDLDAIALQENGDAIFEPYGDNPADQLFFSVRRGSAIIGTNDASGTPIGPGDILMPPSAPQGLPRIAVHAEDLGLAASRKGRSSPLRGDANLNNSVNFQDFVLLSNNFGATGTEWNKGDFNLDNVTNFLDFIIIANYFATSFPSASLASSSQGSDDLTALDTATLCDFWPHIYPPGPDGDETTRDLDMMVDELIAGTNDAIYNFDGDSDIDGDDLDAHLIQKFLTVRGDGDLNAIVNFADFTMISNNFGQSPTGWGEGNFNIDNITNFNDFIILSNNFGYAAVPSVSAPEPATVLLLSVLSWLVRRRSSVKTND